MLEKKKRSVHFAIVSEANMFCTLGHISASEIQRQEKAIIVNM